MGPFRHGELLVRLSGYPVLKDSRGLLLPGTIGMIALAARPLDERGGLALFEAQAEVDGFERLVQRLARHLDLVLGIPEERLCRACVSGEYPTQAGEELYQIALRSRDAAGPESKGGDGRTYEQCATNGMNGHLKDRGTNGELLKPDRVIS